MYSRTLPAVHWTGTTTVSEFARIVSILPANLVCYLVLRPVQVYFREQIKLLEELFPENHRTSILEPSARSEVLEDNLMDTAGQLRVLEDVHHDGPSV